jgi:hypothetical protein
VCWALNHQNLIEMAQGHISLSHSTCVKKETVMHPGHGLSGPVPYTVHASAKAVGWSPS